MIEPERIQYLKGGETRPGKYVYWMQQSQRAEWNHALEFAVGEANERDLPTVVCFGLMDDYPEANERHYAFMLEGLSETAEALKERGIRFVLRLGSPPEVALELSQDAALLVVDCGYLRHQRKWRTMVAEEAPCPVAQVESDAVIPVEAVTDKEEYAARTIRPKIHKRLDDYLKLFRRRPVEKSAKGLKVGGEDVSDPTALLDRLKVDTSVSRVDTYTGGTSEAEAHVERFVDGIVDRYAEERSQPSLDIQSNLSPYLHFGQISPLYVADRMHRWAEDSPGLDDFLEELIVRRELSLNFVHFNPAYDQYDALPDWALRTLEKHASDKREYTYSESEWEAAETHDAYWNAAQREMMATGKMHNTMRMYWGKKLLEWSASPQEAFEVALRLNNRYQLDGRDANSYAGVAWCFGKHDRPWAERPVFGTVRYMNANGLERKYQMEPYLEAWGSR